MADLSKVNFEYLHGTILPNVKPYRNYTFLNRFKNANAPIFTVSDTINFDQEINSLAIAKIVNRTTKAPFGKINGFVRTTQKPGVIKQGAALNPTDSLLLQAGKPIQTANGAVSSLDYIMAKKMTTVMNNIETTAEYLSQEIFINGTAIFENGDKVDYEYDAAEAASFTASDDIIVFIEGALKAYEEANGYPATRVEVGQTLWEKMISNKNFKESVYMFQNKLATVREGKYNMSALEISGAIVSKLPTMRTSKGVVIDTDDMMILSNDIALIAGYAGMVVPALEGQYMGEMATGEIRTDFIVGDRELGLGKLVGQSAYLPIILNKNFIKRYTFTYV